jgi:hypothetical protein
MVENVAEQSGYDAQVSLNVVQNDRVVLRPLESRNNWIKIQLFMFVVV